jgi:hypothetical protein
MNCFRSLLYIGPSIIGRNTYLTFIVNDNPSICERCRRILECGCCPKSPFENSALGGLWQYGTLIDVPQGQQN